MQNKQQYINTVLKVTEEVKNEFGKFSWAEVAYRVKKLYPHKNITYEGVRSVYRRHGKTFKNPDVIRAKTNDTLAGRTNLKDRLLPRLRTKASINQLANYLNVPADHILLALTKLQLEGYSQIKIWSEGGEAFAQIFKRAKDTNNEYDISDKWKNASTITLGIISDTHIGSEYYNEEALNHFYDLMVERGIKTVLHCGDLFEGFKRARPEAFLNNKAIGFQAQLNYGERVFPKRDGVETLVISGNHDEWYMVEGLADIVKTFARIRPDVKFLGNSFARVWLTPKLDLTLFHPNDGTSSNIFGKLQQFLARGGDKRSKINILGHYHKFAYLKHDGMHAFYPASFQRQSNWMSRNNLHSEVGALILTLKVDTNTGDLLSLNFEFIDYNN